MKYPTKAGSLFYHYEEFSSTTLQVVAESENRFIFIDVGAYGKQGDGVTLLWFYYIILLRGL
jgi:endo-1,4-beta-mannosidase